MATRKVKGWWYADFRVAGIRYRKRSPENSRAGAQAWELVLRQRLARGEDIDAKPSNTEKPLAFAEFAREWMETYVRANNKPSEIAMKACILRVHLLPAIGPLPLAQINERVIDQYKARKLSAGLSPKTINNHLTVLRKALCCAHEAGFIERVPTVRWLKYSLPPIVILDARSCEALLAAAPTVRDHAMLLLALTAGLRVGEILGLRCEDVSQESGFITVRHSLVEGVLGTPKSHRPRVVPLSPDLASAIQQLRPSGGRDGTGFVFTRGDGQPLSRDQANWILWRACDRAGLARVGWHRLRHSVGTLLHLGGAPLRAVQSLLGHSTTRMTERYTHVAPQDLRQLVGILPWARQHPESGQQMGSDQKIRSLPPASPREVSVNFSAQQSEYPFSQSFDLARANPLTRQ